MQNTIFVLRKEKVIKMRMQKIIISLLLLILLLTGAVLPLSAEEAVKSSENGNAELLSNGVFSYYIYNNSAVIEKCIDDASSIIVIPDRIGKHKVTEINEGAFSLCPNLKGFSTQNDRFTVINGILYTKDTLLCYPAAKSRKNYIIPPNIKRIADGAFVSNKTLEYIAIPSSVTEIGSEAFADCKALRTVVLHKGITNIPDGAFAFCSSLENIALPDSAVSIGDAAFYECKSLGALNISDRIEKIGKMAFQGCESFSEIYIPENVTNISDWLFTIGSGLKTVKISGKNAEYKEENDIIYTKSGETLVFCPQNADIKRLAIPDGVKEIGEYAFNENKNLESVTLSDSVADISAGAFYNAAALNSITITESLQNIGSYAFFGCDSLGKTVLYTTVDKIGDGAFENCKNLILYAAKGSAAYFYSKQNNVEFAVDETQPEVEIAKWSQGYIDWAESNGITTEITDYTAKLNYEGLCWLLVNLYESVKGPLEITAENPFTDTDSPAVIKAYQLGIIKTYGSDVFDGKRDVSRQVICVEIYRLLEAMNERAPEKGEKNDFRDSADIADWAEEYVNTAYNNGIINGLPDGRINPTGNASIEDALGMLYNASLLIEK